MKAKQKTWKDITLETAMELMSLEKEQQDMSALDFMIYQLSILEDKDIETIENQEPTKIFSDFEKWSFLKQMPKGRFIPYAKIGDEEFGVTPLDKITLAQMVDIEEYYKKGLEENLDKIASILMLPVIEKTLLGKRTLAEYQYDEERVEKMKSLDMEFVWSNMVFFWNGIEEYMRGLLDYSRAMMETTTQRQMPSWQSMTRTYNQELIAQLSPTPKGWLARLSARSGAGSA